MAREEIHEYRIDLLGATDEANIHIPDEHHVHVYRHNGNTLYGTLTAHFARLFREPASAVTLNLIAAGRGNRHGAHRGLVRVRENGMQHYARFGIRRTRVLHDGADIFKGTR